MRWNDEEKQARGRLGVQESLRTVPEELRVAGLRLEEEFVSETDADELLSFCDSQPWETQLSRRTQHYGWRFDYATKSCVRADTAVPDIFVDRVLRRLAWEPDINRVQCTVNEYHKGQGIAPHVDTHQAFDETIVALSLGAGVALRMKRLGAPDPATFLWLEPRSLVTYRGQARYAYTHGIVSRTGDQIDGAWRLRRRRVSLTFRRLPTEPCRCAYPQYCDARGAPKFLPTRLKDEYRVARDDDTNDARRQATGQHSGDNVAGIVSSPSSSSAAAAAAAAAAQIRVVAAAAEDLNNNRGEDPLPLPPA